MSDFMKATMNPGPLDPFKRVNYSQGLVLGVDEFVQEQASYLGRGRLHNRALHGYGTMWGLRVDAKLDGTAALVTVQPGLAVDDLGRELRVDETQCADLNAWLDVESNYNSLTLNGTKAAVFVVLCYQECPTDPVPLPGVACRSDTDSMVAARITETFTLKFAVKLTPEQVQELAIRNGLGQVFSRITLAQDAPSKEAAKAAVIKAVTALGDTVKVPFTSAPTDPLKVAPDDVADVLRAALRVWATDVRPGLLPAEAPQSATPLDHGLLLARINFTLDTKHKATAVEAQDDERPYLLHTRVLQEMLQRQKSITDHGGLVGLADDDHLQYLPVDGHRAMTNNLDLGNHQAKKVAAGTDPDDAVTVIQVGQTAGDLSWVASGSSKILQVDSLQGQALDVTGAQDKLVLTWVQSKNKWLPQKPKHGDLDGLTADDHSLYLPTDGRRSMTANLNVGGKQIKNLADSTDPGDAVSRGQAVAGDLTWSGSSQLQVAKLQGAPVDVKTTPPQPGFLLAWSGTAWVPIAPPTPQSGGIDLATVARDLPETTWVEITRLPGHPQVQEAVPVFELWFHLSFGQSMGLVEPTSLQRSLAVIDDSPGLARGATPIGIKTVTAIKPNVYAVTLTREITSPYLRFVFNVDVLLIDGKVPLRKWASDRVCKLSGHDGAATAVIAYRHPSTLIAAAGAIGIEGNTQKGTTGLTCKVEPETLIYRITFPGFNPTYNYMVNTTAVSAKPTGVQALTCVDIGATGIGVQASVQNSQGGAVPARTGFMVEVIQIFM